MEEEDEEEEEDDDDDDYDDDDDEDDKDDNDYKNNHNDQNDKGKNKNDSNNSRICFIMTGCLMTTRCCSGALRRTSPRAWPARPCSDNQPLLHKLDSVGVYVYTLHIHTCFFRSFTWSLKYSPEAQQSPREADAIRVCFEL